MPIELKSTDPCYAGKLKCLSYVKSFRAFNQCNINEAPSLVNFHTPYIDCELIYNPKSLEHLQQNGGIFDIENTPKMQEILVGFDARSSQLPGLFLYLSFYIRLHNALFIEFMTVNPKMSVTDASFESRRITCAVFQKIVISLIQSVMGKNLIIFKKHISDHKFQIFRLHSTTANLLQLKN